MELLIFCELWFILNILVVVATRWDRAPTWEKGGKSFRTTVLLPAQCSAQRALQKGVNVLSAERCAPSLAGSHIFIWVPGGTFLYRPVSLGYNLLGECMQTNSTNTQLSQLCIHFWKPLVQTGNTQTLRQELT